MADTLFIGLSLASILLLIALGLSITYGAMGVINLAHGELVMIGAYTAVLAGLHLGIGMIWAIPLAFVIAGATGLIMERLVIRHLYGRVMDTLLATWGIAILLQQMIRLEFGLTFFDIHVPGLGPGLQNLDLPGFLSDPFQIGGFTVQPYRSFIIAVTAALTLLTLFLMYRTRMGIQVRAIMRNPDMAAACGVNVKRVSALTFAYGSGLAGVAGVMMAGFKTVSPEMGTSLVVDGFLVVVVGGVGSLIGSVAAAGLLGEVNGIIAMLSNDIIARAAIFGLVIGIIMWRPAGLFSFRGR
ncbi:urea ABC transporter permease subunit UrtB [Marinibacterium sp. SX1]|uniref:urea ABC transporter permease subunit UrtB n=1 Tax=Marinibacterium sp. SX1 TaxID=3388424 RepID=UPI003D16B792